MKSMEIAAGAQSESLKCLIGGEFLELNPNEPNIHLAEKCIVAIHERYIIASRRREENRARTNRYQIQRRGIEAEIELCFMIGLYLVACRDKFHAPGIQATLDKLDELLVDDRKILANRGLDDGAIMIIFANIREKPQLAEYLDMFLAPTASSPTV